MVLSIKEQVKLTCNHKRLPTGSYELSFTFGANDETLRQCVYAALGQHDQIRKIVQYAERTQETLTVRAIIDGIGKAGSRRATKIEQQVRRMIVADLYYSGFVADLH